MPHPMKLLLIEFFSSQIITIRKFLFQFFLVNNNGVAAEERFGSSVIFFVLLKSRLEKRAVPTIVALVETQNNKSNDQK